MNTVTLGALLLLVGGVVNTIPPLGAGLTGIFNGTPVIQIALGIVSAVVGLVILVKKMALS